MAYCTQTNIENMFGEKAVRNLLDADQSGAVDSDEAGILTAAISSAENRINARLNGAYSVPFSTTPGIVQDIACQLAFAFLCIRLGREFATVSAIMELGDRDLAALAAGKMTLPSTGRGEPIAHTSEGEAVFTRTKTDHAGNKVNTDEHGSMDVW